MSERNPGEVDWDARPAPAELARLDEETVRRSLLAHLDELEQFEPFDPEEIGRNGVALSLAGFSATDEAVVAWRRSGRGRCASCWRARSSAGSGRRSWRQARPRAR
jgi:hypothetical protein